MSAAKSVTATFYTTPTVTTARPTSLSAITASASGQVTSDGGGTVTARGICWSTSANPTTGGTCASGGSGVGSFTAGITDLTGGTIYHVRAYATNGAGTVYGEDRTLVAGSVFYEDGEATTEGWTATGFWHVVTNPETYAVTNPAISPNLVSLPDSGRLPRAYSGVKAWWYGENATGTILGNDYDVSVQVPKGGGTSQAPNAGDLTSPAIALPSGTTYTLEFYAWWEIEGVASHEFDLMSMQVSEDDGATWNALGRENLNPVRDVTQPPEVAFTNNGPSTPASWQHYLYNLSAYAGKTVRIRFRFDTVDEAYNAFRGWLVDDIRIATPGPSAPQVVALSPSVGRPNAYITVTGANFSPGAVLTLGTTEVPDASALSSTTMLFKVPALAPGTYDVTVTNPDLQAGTLVTGLTVSSDAAPVVTSITPDSGVAGTPVLVTIAGSGFVAGASTFLGTAPLTGVTVSATQITGTPPLLPPGTYNVWVVNPDGQRGVKFGAYTLTGSMASPTATTVASSVNPSEAGQDVTFTASTLPSDATGTVAFYVDGVLLGIGDVSGGVATASTSSLSSATHAITAVYSGNATYELSVGSLTVGQSVNVPTLPVVTTTAISGMTISGASSGGNVTADGGRAVTARGVCWNVSANPTVTDSCTADGTGMGAFTSALSGLAPGTPYHVRAYATSAVGTGYGSDRTFATLYLPPVVSGVSPEIGGIAGGTTVTITGTAFRIGAAVTFGGTAALSVSFVDSATLTAVTPAHAAGAADVVVVNDDAQSSTLMGGFTFHAAPTVTAVSPVSGPAAGGTTVTITGAGFRAGATVTFGGTAATSVTVVNATTMTVATPAHSAGTADVVVTNNDAQTGTLAGGFTFYAAPTATAVSPVSGPAAGGTTVTITGTAFRTEATVTFGGTAATSVIVV
ncbi:MAG TPA: IPT/TIG domain-containing protein, partial [Pengzhenrongella sp.]